MRDPQEPVSFVVESYPPTQRERELVFVEKFAGALAHFHGRKLQNLQKNPNDFPDILAEENGIPVGIEVLEVHDRGRRNRVLEGEYSRALASRLEIQPIRVPGLSITIWVEHPKDVPRLRSPRGRKLLEAIEKALIELLPTCTSLQEGRGKVIRRIDPKTSARFVVSAWRIGGAGAQVGVVFPLAIDIKDAAHVISDPLSKKLRKYPLLSGSTLYLLVVDWDVNLTTEDALNQGQKVASSVSHLFSEIWYMRPIPNEKLGAVHQLWP